MADIVDLNSLIRRDDTVDGIDAFDDHVGEISRISPEGPSSGDSDVTLGQSADGLIDFAPRRDADSASDLPDPRRDWSNQELADLYRVQRLLAQAGVSVGTDRGVTDEGDPWFVFLDSYGEVFVHLCRIDGAYVMDSAVQEGVVSGPCFATLIERFAGRAEGAAAIRPDGKNVVSLRRRGKIVMHPGAALAALVWSILLTTEELTLLDEPIADAAAKEGDAGDAEGEAAPLPSVDLADTPADPFQELFVDADDAAAFLAHARAEKVAQDRATPADLRDGPHVSAASAHVSTATMTGMGLTALAAAYGLNRTQNNESADTQDAGVDVALSSAEGLALTSVADEEAVAVEDDTAHQATAGRIFATDASGHEVSGPNQEEVAEAAPSELSAAELAALAAEQAESTNALAKADVSGPGGDAPSGSAETPAHKEASRLDTGEAKPAPSREQERAELATLLESFGLDDVVSGETDVLGSYNDPADDGSDTLLRLIDDTLKVTSFDDIPNHDVTMAGPNDAENALAVHEDDSVPEPMAAGGDGSITPFQQFSSEARDFIDYLVLHTEIEIIALANQILVIDVRALEADRAETFARTWTLDEERVVSTIGVKADFEAFDLIA